MKVILILKLIEIYFMMTKCTVRTPCIGVHHSFIVCIPYAILLRSIVQGFFIICLDINEHVQSNCIRKVPPIVSVILILFYKIKIKIVCKIKLQIILCAQTICLDKQKVLWSS